MHTGLYRELLANHEIPVAVHEKHRRTGLDDRSQRRLYGRVVRIGIIVANPGFEQVTEDKQRIGAQGFLFEEFDQLFTDLRPRGLQVQIRNKQGCHKLNATVIVA